MTGQNPKPVEPKTPLEKALFDKLNALEAKLTDREKAESAAADTAKVQASLDTFVTVVKTDAEKYPLISKEPLADQREAALIYSRRYHQDHGKWPTHAEVAGGLEAGMRAHLEQNGSTEVAQMRDQIAALEAKLASLKSTQAATPGTSDRSNGAGPPAKPARPQTLSNGQYAAATAANGKALSLPDRRAAARRLLG